MPSGRASAQEDLDLADGSSTLLEFLVKHMPTYIDSEAKFDMYLTAWLSNLNRRLKVPSTGSIFHHFYMQCVIITA